MSNWVSRSCYKGIQQSMTSFVSRTSRLTPAPLAPITGQTSRKTCYHLRTSPSVRVNICTPSLFRFQTIPPTLYVFSGPSPSTAAHQVQYQEVIVPQRPYAANIQRNHTRSIPMIQFLVNNRSGISLLDALSHNFRGLAQAEDRLLQGFGVKVTDRIEVSVDLRERTGLADSGNRFTI